MVCPDAEAAHQAQVHWLAAMAALAAVVLSVMVPHQAVEVSAGVEHHLIPAAGRLAVMAALVGVALAVVVIHRLILQALAVVLQY